MCQKGVNFAPKFTEIALSWFSIFFFVFISYNVMPIDQILVPKICTLLQQAYIIRLNYDEHIQLP